MGGTTARHRSRPEHTLPVAAGPKSRRQLIPSYSSCELGRPPSRRLASFTTSDTCPLYPRKRTCAVHDMTGAAATAGEGDVSLSACVLQRWRHNTGSHCRSHDCLPKYCLCGSSLRTSDTGSPNSYYLGLIGSPRTRGPGKPGPAVARKTHRQDQRWQLN